METTNDNSNDEVIVTIKENDSFRDSLTREELDRIKEMREFNDLQPGTWAYRAFLHSDQLNINKLKVMIGVDKSISHMAEFLAAKNHSNRVLLGATNSTEQSVLEEARANVLRHDFAINAELNSLPLNLVDLYRIVGRKRIDSTIVMSQEEFDAYCDDVQRRVESLGLKLNC